MNYSLNPSSTSSTGAESNGKGTVEIFLVGDDDVEGTSANVSSADPSEDILITGSTAEDKWSTGTGVHGTSTVISADSPSTGEGRTSGPSTNAALTSSSSAFSTNLLQVSTQILSILAASNSTLRTTSLLLSLTFLPPQLSTASSFVKIRLRSSSYARIGTFVDVNASLADDVDSDAVSECEGELVLSTFRVITSPSAER